MRHVFADASSCGPHAEEARSAVSKHAVRRSAPATLAAVLLLALFLAPAFAVNPGEQLSDPAEEARARALGAEVRCMVCQNQSIDDSDASLAKDLRVLVRERVKAGDGDDAVMDFLVERYGEFVLLRPRLRGETLLLWGLAPAVLAFGLIGYAVFAVRARRRTGEGAALSEAEKSRLDALLGPDAAGWGAVPSGNEDSGLPKFHAPASAP